jgi:hypothetical protein
MLSETNEGIVWKQMVLSFEIHPSHPEPKLGAALIRIVLS